MNKITSINGLKDFVLTKLQDKLAENIVVVNSRSPLAEYIIIVSGRSTKNVSFMADYLSVEVKYHSNFNVQIEGIELGEWVVLDLGDIIVHIFHPEARSYYNIEEIYEN